MPHVRCAAVCVALLLSPLAASAQRTPADPAATILSTSGAAMLAVARAITEETWNPILDGRIQEAPTGRRLGAAWTPADPRWQKARAALGARMTRILDAYAKSTELTDHVRQEAERIGPGAAINAAVAMLTGPAGTPLVRQHAKRNYIVSVLTVRPGGPAIGSPEWNAQIRDAGVRFDNRVGTSLPPDDGSHKAELEKLAVGPGADALARVWTFAVSNATRQHTAALNLMVFDDQAAIDRDIATAIGRSGGAAAPTDSFSLDRMATCQDSWLEWGNDDTRVGAFRDGFRAQFKENEGGVYFVPITSASLLGMKVARVYSSTIGMARGFSVAVDAPFDTAKKNMEKAIGKSLKHCDTSDGLRTCDLEIADKRTVMLMADATGREKTTLVGCFYFYEK